MILSGRKNAFEIECSSGVTALRKVASSLNFLRCFIKEIERKLKSGADVKVLDGELSKEIQGGLGGEREVRLNLKRPTTKACGQEQWRSHYKEEKETCFLGRDEVDQACDVRVQWRSHGEKERRLKWVISFNGFGVWCPSAVTASQKLGCEWQKVPSLSEVDVKALDDELSKGIRAGEVGGIEVELIFKRPAAKACGQQQWRSHYKKGKDACLVDRDKMGETPAAQVERRSHGRREQIYFFGSRIKQELARAVVIFRIKWNGMRSIICDGFGVRCPSAVTASQKLGCGRAYDWQKVPSLSEVDFKALDGGLSKEMQEGEAHEREVRLNLKNPASKACGQEQWRSHGGRERGLKWSILFNSSGVRCPSAVTASRNLRCGRVWSWQTVQSLIAIDFKVLDGGWVKEMQGIEADEHEIRSNLKRPVAEACGQEQWRSHYNEGKDACFVNRDEARDVRVRWQSHRGREQIYFFGSRIKQELARTVLIFRIKWNEIRSVLCDGFDVRCPSAVTASQKLGCGQVWSWQMVPSLSGVDFKVLDGELSKKIQGIEAGEREVRLNLKRPATKACGQERWRSHYKEEKNACFLGTDEVSEAPGARVGWGRHGGRGRGLNWVILFNGFGVRCPSAVTASRKLECGRVWSWQTMRSLSAIDFKVLDGELSKEMQKGEVGEREVRLNLKRPAAEAWGQERWSCHYGAGENPCFLGRDEVDETTSARTELRSHRRGSWMQLCGIIVRQKLARVVVIFRIKHNKVRDVMCDSFGVLCPSAVTASQKLGCGQVWSWQMVPSLSGVDFKVLDDGWVKEMQEGEVGGAEVRLSLKCPVAKAYGQEQWRSHGGVRGLKRDIICDGSDVRCPSAVNASRKSGYDEMCGWKMTQSSSVADFKVLDGGLSKEMQGGETGEVRVRLSLKRPAAKACGQERWRSHYNEGKDACFVNRDEAHDVPVRWRSHGGRERIYFFGSRVRQEFERATIFFLRTKQMLESVMCNAFGMRCPSAVTASRKLGCGQAYDWRKVPSSDWIDFKVLDGGLSKEMKEGEIDGAAVGLSLKSPAAKACGQEGWRSHYDKVKDRNVCSMDTDEMRDDECEARVQWRSHVRGGRIQLCGRIVGQKLKRAVVVFSIKWNRLKSFMCNGFGVRCPSAVTVSQKLGCGRVWSWRKVPSLSEAYFKLLNSGLIKEMQEGEVGEVRVRLSLKRPAAKACGQKQWRSHYDKVNGRNVCFMETDEMRELDGAGVSLNFKCSAARVYEGKRWRSHEQRRLDGSENLSSYLDVGAGQENATQRPDIEEFTNWSEGYVRTVLVQSNTQRENSKRACSGAFSFDFFIRREAI